MTSVLLAFAVLAGLLGSVTAGPVLAPVPGPYHAFCRTLWLFATPCAEVSSKIVEQIQVMHPAEGCDLCHYMLVSATNVSIKANHSSPDGLQVENLTFTLSPTMLTGGCRVSGQSTSLGFTSLLDDGLNYCNLYDVVSESGLTSTPGFLEMINEWACLGFGLATCRG